MSPNGSDFQRNIYIFGSFGQRAFAALFGRPLFPVFLMVFVGLGLTFRVSLAVACVFFVGAGLCFLLGGVWIGSGNRVLRLTALAVGVAFLLSFRMSVHMATGEDYGLSEASSLRLTQIFWGEGREWGRSVSLRGVDVAVEDVVILGSGSYRRVHLQMENNVRAVWYTDAAEIPSGYRVVLQGDLHAPERRRNPGGFDEAEYLAKKGIFWVFEGSASGSLVEDLGWEDRLGSLVREIKDGAEHLRYQIRKMWEEVLPDSQAALLTGMMVGDTSGMDVEMKSQFQRANLSHLMAVSGSNVALFLTPISVFLAKARSKRSYRKYLIFAFLLLFGFVTGWSASVTRAILMSAGSLFYTMAKRRYDPLNALWATGLILCVVSPYYAIDPGFRLSFGASMGMIFLAKPIEKRLGKIPVPGGWKNGLASTVAAWLGMFPFLGETGSKVSVALFFVNMAAVLVSEGISLMALGWTVFTLPLKFFGVDILRIIYLPLSGLLTGLEKIAEWGALWSRDARAISLFQPLLLLLLGLVAFWVAIPAGKLSRICLRCIVPLLLCCFVMENIAFLWRPSLTVVAADVGQGDGILIVTGSGKSLLIDGGNTGMGRNVLSPLLDAYGISCPDICIITHWDSDHAKGIEELVGMGRIQEVYACTDEKDMSSLLGYESGSASSNPLEIYREQGKITLSELRKNDTIALDSETTLTVLWPDGIRDGGKNEDSVVLFLEHRDMGILFTGDIGVSTERLLLDDENVGLRLADSADILKIGHHGSKYSSSEEFLDHLSPEAAIISVGDNRYGHPSQEVLERLRERDIVTYRTDQSGAVIVEYRDDGFAIYEYCAAA